MIIVTANTPSIAVACTVSILASRKLSFNYCGSCKSSRCTGIDRGVSTLETALVTTFCHCRVKINVAANNATCKRDANLGCCMY